MTADDPMLQVLDALSARVAVIEGALIALAPWDEGDRVRALAIYDAVEKRTLDGYIGPVPAAFLDPFGSHFQTFAR